MAATTSRGERQGEAPAPPDSAYEHEKIPGGRQEMPQSLRYGQQTNVVHSMPLEKSLREICRLVMTWISQSLTWPSYAARGLVSSSVVHDGIDRRRHMMMTRITTICHFRQNRLVTWGI